MNAYGLLASLIKRDGYDYPNSFIVTFQSSEVDDIIDEFIQWCFAYECLPYYMKDPIKAGMPTRITLRCPDEKTLLLAKLTWGGK